MKERNEIDRPLDETRIVRCITCPNCGNGEEAVAVMTLAYGEGGEAFASYHIACGACQTFFGSVADFLSVTIRELTGPRDTMEGRDAHEAINPNLN